MNIFQAIILGIIQGLTEFIPVSSSGHLYLIPQILGWAPPSTVLITVLDWGTLIALIYYYRKLILKYIKVTLKFLSSKGKLESQDEANSWKVVVNIALATIPAGIIGFLAEKLISEYYDTPDNFRSAMIITTIAMIVVGILFIYSDKFFKNNTLENNKLSPAKALLIGVSQAFAFIRGVSRSGVTFLSGQSLGLKPVDAAEFAFLMSIPIIGVSTLYQTYQLLTLPNANSANDITVAIVGSVFSFIFGMLAINFMLKYLKTKGLKNFGWYRIAFGILTLLIILL